MSTEVPKAILYTWHTSVWGTVPRLCLYEKGYAEDEYITRQVDITKGENFSPAYLKINMNGTIPTLVVPMLETTGADVDVRYRSLRDTISICDFLDSARTSTTHNTTSSRPAPILTPATIEGKATSDQLIALCHQPSVDPNFLAMACRNTNELTDKAKGGQGQVVRDRRMALQRYVKEAEAIAKEASGGEASTDGKALTYERKVVAFLQEKMEANEVLWEVYNGTAGAEKEKVFYEASAQAWTQGLPEVLGKMETVIKGPFALGDQVCLADLHMIAWLARLIGISGGQLGADDYQKLEAHMQSKLGDKMKAFWAAWTERESFKKTVSSWPDLMSEAPACEIKLL